MPLNLLQNPEMHVMIHFICIGNARVKSNQTLKILLVFIDSVCTDLQFISLSDITIDEHVKTKCDA